MVPGAHLIMSWLCSVELLQERRERTLVALSGIAPDLDGLGIIIDKLTGTSNLFFKYHHYLGHSFLFACVVAALVMCLAKVQKLKACLLSLFVVHLHILCDLAGSKGADGYQWPIYYFYPFSYEYSLTWSNQWELNAWPNLLIMFLLIMLSAYYAITKKFSFLEVFSKRLDQEMFKIYGKYARKK